MLGMILVGCLTGLVFGLVFGDKTQKEGFKSKKTPSRNKRWKPRYTPLRHIHNRD